MTYMLVALILGQSYVLDTGMSLADCGRAIAGEPVTIHLDNNQRSAARGATFVCEAE